jgi:hypothetical protein
MIKGVRQIRLSLGEFLNSRGLRNSFRWLSLVVGLLCVTAAWVVTRYPYFKHYMVPNFSLDFGSYADIAHAILDGKNANFSMRPVGYPVFVAALTSIFGSNQAILVAQSLLLILAMYILLISVFSIWAPGALLVGVCLCPYLFLWEQMCNDFSLMSEGLYTSCLILLVAALVRGIVKESLVSLLLVSTLVVTVVLIRPAGLFLVPVLALLVSWFALGRRAWKKAVALVLPFAIVSLGYSSYNYSVAGFFGLTGFGEANFVAATSWFWTEREEYPEGLKKAIHNATRSLPVEQADILRTSWDFQKLYPIYSGTYNQNLYGYLYSYFYSAHPYHHSNGFIRDFKLANASQETISNSQRKLLFQVASDAVLSHPEAYLKFVLTQMYGYFWLSSDSKKWDFYDYPLPGWYLNLFVNRSFGSASPEQWRRRVLLEYFEPKSLGGFTVTQGSQGSQVSLVGTRSLAIERTVRSYIQPIIASHFWSLVALLVAPLAFIKFVVSRFNSKSALLLLVMSGMVLCHALVVCLVEISLTRYVIPVDFLNYVLVGLAPLLVPVPKALGIFTRKGAAIRWCAKQPEGAKQVA